jgi:hypothetical protein
MSFTANTISTNNISGSKCAASAEFIIYVISALSLHPLPEGEPGAANRGCLGGQGMEGRGGGI